MNNKFQLISTINKCLDTEFDKPLELLKDLVSFNSVSFKEGTAIKYLKSKMIEFGFDEVRIDKLGNVIGRIGDGKTTILYDAHIDIVKPGDEVEWGFNPLKVQVKDGYAYGRGVVDDKGCLAAITYAGKLIKSICGRTDFTLWILGSVAEEAVTGACAEAMLYENSDIVPDYILVAEPSESRIIRGHKGKALIKIIVPGKCAHASSAWRGDNALVKALPIMEGIDKFDSLGTDGFLGKGTIEVTNVECKAPSLNTIPGEVTITCDCRIACGETAEQLLKRLEPVTSLANGARSFIETHKVHTYTGYEIECTDHFPSWVMPDGHEIIRAGRKTYHELFGREPIVDKWDFCTNGTSLCGRAHIPCIGFGPGDGTLCHSIEEKVSIDEMINAIKFYVLLPFFICEEIEETL